MDNLQNRTEIKYTEMDLIKVWNASRDYHISTREGIGKEHNYPDRETFIQSLNK